jgi:D-hexose-6-phosphate mutarotase
MRAEELRAEFGIAGTLAFVETEHGLVKAVISLDDITGELYLHGAQVTAWRPPGEQPVLFTSPNAVFASGKAIRGGVPIIFRGSVPTSTRERRRSTALRVPHRGTSMGWRPRAARR